MTQPPFEVRDQVRENEQPLPLTDCQRFGHVWIGVPADGYPTTARCAKCGAASDAVEELAESWAKEFCEACPELPPGAVAVVTQLLASFSAAASQEARGYLIRNVLLPLHPNIEPAPDLIDVCAQVDNVTVGLREERDAAVAVLQRIADLEGRAEYTDHDFTRDVLKELGGWIRQPTLYNTVWNQYSR